MKRLGCLEQPSLDRKFGHPNYFFAGLASGALAGDPDAGAAGDVAGAVAGVVDAGADGGVAGFIVFAGEAGLAALLAGVSPHAIPRAPIANTEASAIVFFIN